MSFLGIRSVWKSRAADCERICFYFTRQAGNRDHSYKPTSGPQYFRFARNTFKIRDAGPRSEWNRL